MDFRNVYAQGFARVAACTLPVAIADPMANAERIIEQVRACHDDGVAVALFPELSLSGYAIDDLLLQDVLLDAVDAALEALTRASRELLPVMVLGAPIRHQGRLYNCGVVIHRGEILAVAPKSFLPNYREFYEKRHFADGVDQRDAWLTPEIPFGPDLIVDVEDVSGLSLHVEVCEDMWVPVPPSHKAALAGATVLLNLSASPITVGRAEDRHLLARAASSRCNAAYVYAAASAGESTTDLSWDGMTMVYELGDLLAEGERFPHEARRTIVDVDLFPFVPDDADRLAQDCYEAYNIQVSGLEQRLRAIGGGDPARMPKIVIGVSGGLDSTHALIVAAKACDRLGLPRTHILAFTMPGFATTEHTKGNATLLSQALGVTFETVDITALATQLLKDLGHPFGRGEEVYDITFENVQAGVRTDLLFRAANQRGGIVLGTGDLSELALGWCTYGVGDQMSHYGVNTGVPKTLMQHLIRWVISSEQFDEKVGVVLQSILDTEITPELIPTKAGEKPQSTQDTIGPYALHDFTLFHVLRRGYRPTKIAFLAEHAWSDGTSGEWPPGYPEAERTAYDLPTITHWLGVFLKRFFGNQFKRSALPNGPKVVAGGSLSPRGDWRMPSDASAAAWLAELAKVPVDPGR